MVPLKVRPLKEDRVGCWSSHGRWQKPYRLPLGGLMLLLVLLGRGACGKCIKVLDPLLTNLPLQALLETRAGRFIGVSSQTSLGTSTLAPIPKDIKS